MSVILLVVGILITGAGLVAIGFGVTINGLAIGQSLIIAGAIGLSGGLVVIGLAAVLIELTRIAVTLRAGNLIPRAAPARPAEAPLKLEPPVRPEPPLKPEPQFRPEPQLRPAEAQQPRPEPPARTPAPRPPEPRLAAEPQPAAETAVDVSANAIERLRSSLPRPDRVVVSETEEVPLSPNGPTHPAAEPAAESKPAEAAPPAPAAAAVEAVREPRLDFLFRSRAARPAQPENFDSVWPQRASRAPEGAAKQDDAARAPAGERQVAVVTSSASEVMRAPSRPAAAAPAAAPAPAPEESRSAAILKSGVVDGMAYTLYADGSIEAQLPQGTVRFGSIAELRAHIESSS